MVLVRDLAAFFERYGPLIGGSLGKDSGARLRLDFTRTDSGWRLRWAAGRVQSSVRAEGEWTDLPGTSSPYRISPTGSGRFFRLRE